MSGNPPAARQSEDCPIDAATDDCAFGRAGAGDAAEWDAWIRFDAADVVDTEVVGSQT